MKAMIYKGYAARIEFDAEDQIFTGRIAGIKDVIGFHADTVQSLIAAFHEAVDDYLDACRKVGKAPQKSHSGSLMFRVSPDLHSKVALAADLAGKSINEWGQEVLERAIADESSR